MEFRAGVVRNQSRYSKIKTLKQEKSGGCNEWFTVVPEDVIKGSQLYWWLCGATKQDRSSLRINFNEYEEARPPTKNRCRSPAEKTPPWPPNCHHWLFRK